MTKRHELIRTRKEKGYTQQELAEKVGISRAFLANIERGEHAPSLKVACDIAAVLGKPVEQLFFENDVRIKHIEQTTA